MSRYNLECIVLKSVNYKDSDRIYALYSKTRGKVFATAKGVRKISSRRAGGLDTLNHVVIGVSESVSGFKTINEVKVIDSFKSLKTNLESISKAYYMLELTYRSMGEEIENTQVFDLLQNCASSLAVGMIDPISAAIAFELKFLDVSGYRISINACAICGKHVSKDWKSCRFNINLGGLLCPHCLGAGSTLSFDEVTLLNYLSNYNFSSKFDLNIPVESLRKASELTRYIIREVLDENIKSLVVFKSV